MDFEFTEEQRMLRDSVRKMMAKFATPEYVRKLDREQAFPDELYAEWLNMGLFRMPFPEEYGGLGGNVIDMVIIAEELSYKSFDLFTAYGGPVFCGLNILRKGTEEQKRHWIPKMLAGEVKFSISMSEPDAGSDIGAMRTNAKREGNDWLINGQKLWATGAGAKNNVINVYVKTDPSVFYRKGMSLFLVDNNTPGVELRKLNMLGRRCTGTYEIFFTDVRVPNERLLGGENNGWQVVLSGLQVERITSTSGYIGGMQAILDLALDYAKERKQFGRPIGTNQVMAHLLADMQTELEASRLMMWRAAWMLASGKDALKEISMAKLFASEAATRAADSSLQVLGGYGYLSDFPIERNLRDTRLMEIGEGTSEVQRIVIARELLRVD